MRDIELDPFTHDLVLTGGDLRVVDGVTQHLKQRLLTILGEWFLDLSIGIPWFDEILGKGNDLTLAESLIKSTISDTPGVRSLVTFNIEASQTSERTALVSFTITLDNGSEQQMEVEV